jgi:hypothetical protein
VSLLAKYRLAVSIVGVVTLAVISWIPPAESEPSVAASGCAVVTSADEPAVVWSWLKDTRDPSQLERFIKCYSDSPYTNEARDRLELLRRDSTAVKPATARAAPAYTSPPSIAVASRPHRPVWECVGFWCISSFPVVLGVGF